MINEGFKILEDVPKYMPWPVLGVRFVGHHFPVSAATGPGVDSRVRQEGYVARSSDIDLAYIYGYGFPPAKAGNCISMHPLMSLIVAPILLSSSHPVARPSFGCAIMRARAHTCARMVLS